MALSEEGGMSTTMLVGPTGTGGMPYPVYMNGQGGGAQGGFDQGNGWWIILLFILLASGNWGGAQNGQNGGFGGAQPIILNDGGNSSSVQRGFDQAAIMGGINGVQSGVQNLSTQLCNCCNDMQNTVNQGFFGVQNALCNGFNGIEQSANTRQIANMQQAFAAQTAMSQGFNNLGSQLADCCCENRLATNDLKYTIATENCADRQALSDGIRDLLAAQTAGIQSIKDQLCQDKIDQKNDTIAQLRQELLYARGQDSQDLQTSRILAGQTAQTDAIYNRFRDCPVPTMPVYGMTPIFTCPNNNNSCGCGCGGSNF